MLSLYNQLQLQLQLWTICNRSHDYIMCHVILICKHIFCPSANESRQLCKAAPCNSNNYTLLKFAVYIRARKFWYANAIARKRENTAQTNHTAIALTYDMHNSHDCACVRSQSVRTHSHSNCVFNWSKHMFKKVSQPNRFKRFFLI